MTFEDIQRANAQIVTTNIKGKEYAEVNERILAFRKLYPEGFIKTDLVSNENGVCVMKGTVGYYDEEGRERILGEAYAYEKENANFINKGSFIEVCCTSVTGRAIGKLGLFGNEGGVASYEEVANAIANQEPRKQPEKKKAAANPMTYQDHITEKDWNVLKAACESVNMDPKELLERYQFKKPSEITYSMYYDMFEYLKG